MVKKLTLNKLKNLQPQDIPGSKNLSQLRSMVTQARELYSKRKISLKKAKLSWSPALEKVEAAGVGLHEVKKMSAAALQAELIRIQQFFQARTSTAAGAREVMREQDASIFGTDANGNPLYRMSKAQRDKYWELYEKFATTYSVTAAAMGSDQLKIFLGDYMKQTKKSSGEIGADILAELNKKYWEQQDENRFERLRLGRQQSSRASVYRGTWHDFSGGTSGKHPKHKK